MWEIVALNGDLWKVNVLKKAIILGHCWNFSEFTKLISILELHHIDCYFFTGLYCLQVLILKELKKKSFGDLQLEDDENLDNLPICSEEDYYIFKKKLSEFGNLKKKLVSEHSFLVKVKITQNHLYSNNVCLKIYTRTFRFDSPNIIRFWYGVYWFQKQLIIGFFKKQSFQDKYEIQKGKLNYKLEEGKKIIGRLT